MISKSALSEGPKFPIFRIGLNLLVPHFGVKLYAPITECLQLVQAEAFHLSLYVLDSTHLKLHYQITPHRDCEVNSYSPRSATTVTSSLRAAPLNSLTSSTMACTSASAGCD
jgi:hypothetical protein